LNGDDVLNGAAGADSFVFAGNFGNDVIENFATSAFNAVHDLIVFASGSEVSNFNGFIAASTQVGSNVVYDLGDDGVNMITINNTNLNNMTAADFDFL